MCGSNALRARNGLRESKSVTQHAVVSGAYATVQPWPSRWHLVYGRHTMLPRREPHMSPIPDDLTTVKDDMIAFIEGHGMRRFHGDVDYDEAQCRTWEWVSNAERREGFDELAQSACHHVLTL